MQLWVADGEQGLMRSVQGCWQRIGPPAEALCFGWGRVFSAGQERWRCCDPASGETLLDGCAPPGVCSLAVLSDRLCALSSEADSVTAYSVHTGQTLFSAPAGIYPRDLCVSRQGRFLAVAGGAAGEVLLLDRDLRFLRAYPLPGTVCGVCFQPRGMAALCAVENGALSARLFFIRYRGITQEVATFPLLPSCLCALPGGGCAAACHGEAIWIGPNKKIIGRRMCSCPSRIRYSLLGPLICDTWQGDVAAWNGKTLYRGKNPLDALLLP